MSGIDSEGRPKTADDEERSPFIVRGMEVAFENPWIRIEDHDVLRPDGAPGEYGVVRFKNRAIGVLPIDAAGRVPLVGQHRFPLGRYSWELPEGGGAKDIAPLEAAKRELKEETGMTARAWLELSAFDVSNSVTDEVATCFLAWDLTEGTAAPDPTEVLQTRLVAFSDLLTMCLSGEIRDSLTLVMAFSAHIKAARGDLPDEVARLIVG